tara:strand:+ start:4008 stop:4865 length:858 start_codon:yes stop_codon:yes gene_type:complete
MKIKLFTVLVALFIISHTVAQVNLNDYKYVVVPKKYGFLKEENQYRLNELAQFLFNKIGFETVMEGDNYPEDLIRNRCLGLKSDVIKDSGLFKTKLNIELKDCNDQVVYTGQVGESREKDYEKSYNEALRNAFKSFDGRAYKYVPKVNTGKAEDLIVAKTNKESVEEIKELKKEIETLKQEKIADGIPTEEAKINITETTTIIETKTSLGNNKDVSNVLYAQATENGFQLVDSTPKVVYRLQKTGLDNVFLLESKSALLYKKGENWMLEYYDNNVLKQEVLNIKF